MKVEIVICHSSRSQVVNLFNTVMTQEGKTLNVVLKDAVGYLVLF